MGKRRIPAVDSVSLNLARGEAVALVGESGCGKSVTAMALTRLPPTDSAEVTGEVRLDSQLLSQPADFKSVRGGGVAYVFQEAQASLNPVMRIGTQMCEVTGSGASGKARACELLAKVELRDVDAVMRAFPCELSGGMQQRVVIAMALACEAKLIVADEPTTALDVTTQARVLKLLDKVRREENRSILLITHNLGLVAEYASRVYVMYSGHVVESGDVSSILKSPAHPYTHGLLQAVPRLDARSGTELSGIPGAVPSPERRPAGCRFAERCPRCRDACREAVPDMHDVTGIGHMVRCLFPLPPMMKERSSE